MANEGFNLKRLYEDSKKALFQPKAYFSSMPIEGGLGEPILKALVYGAVAGVFVLIWSLLNLTGFTGGIFGGAVGIAGFFWSIIAAVIGVFIGGLITLIISAVCGGNTEFEPNMRVAAALLVLMPINAFLGFFDGISFALGAVVSLVVNLYGLYMLYQAVRGVLKGKEQTARIVSYVLGAVLVLFMIIGLATRSAVRKAGWDQDKVKEMMKDYKDEMNDAEKKMEELEEEMEEERQ